MESSIRSEQRAGVTVVSLIFGPVFVFGPPIWGILNAVHSAYDLTSILVLAGTLFWGAWAAYNMLQNCHWVEFDGRYIRGRRFWTRALIQQDISDLVKIRRLFSGWLLVFRKGPSVGLLWGDMKNAETLSKAVAAKWDELKKKPQG
jgi:hypothetical protein